MVATRSRDDACIRTDASLGDRTRVFRDRLGAGARLARLLAPEMAPDAVVFGLAPGGMPVAWQVARYCRRPLEVAVAAPLTPPWSDGPAYGAVAWDGSVQFDQPLLEALDLHRRDAARAMDDASRQIAAAIACRGRPLPVICDRPAILVDDGSAAPIVIEAAAAALRNAGAGPLWLALAAQTRRSAQRLAAAVDRVYCANLHLSCRFQVTDAYLDLAPLGMTEAIAMTRTQGAAVTGVSASGRAAE